MVWYGMVWYGMVWYGMVCTVPTSHESTLLELVSPTLSDSEWDGYYTKCIEYLLWNSRGAVGGRDGVCSLARGLAVLFLPGYPGCWSTPPAACFYAVHESVVLVSRVFVGQTSISFFVKERRDFFVLFCCWLGGRGLFGAA